jgi:hypothetical protein
MVAYDTVMVVIGACKIDQISTGPELFESFKNVDFGAPRKECYSTNVGCMMRATWYQLYNQSRKPMKQMRLLPLLHTSQLITLQNESIEILREFVSLVCNTTPPWGSLS